MKNIKVKTNQEKIEIKEVSKIAGLSSKEVSVISWLEFYQKYFFISEDINFFFDNKRALYRIIEKLHKKKRIIKLNKNKYYLVPIKARTGKWSEHEFIMVDELCNSGEYYIGGWSAANHWRLTDQIPAWIDVYAKNKQGKKIIGNTRIIFHRVRKIDKGKYIIKKIKGHEFKILKKGESKRWLRLREYLL